MTGPDEHADLQNDADMLAVRGLRSTANILAECFHLQREGRDYTRLFPKFIRMARKSGPIAEESLISSIPLVTTLSADVLRTILDSMYERV